MTNTRRDEFVQSTVAWLNQRFAPADCTIEAETPLFEGLLDSIRILKLIAWTEAAIGRPIPDQQIRMDNFASVARIADCFLPEAA